MQTSQQAAGEREEAKICAQLCVDKQANVKYSKQQHHYHHNTYYTQQNKTNRYIFGYVKITADTRRNVDPINEEQYK